MAASSTGLQCNVLFLPDTYANHPLEIGRILRLPATDDFATDQRLVGLVVTAAVLKYSGGRSIVRACASQQYRRYTGHPHYRVYFLYWY